MKLKEDIRFSGIMKTTLLDFPGHVACTLFLTGCNMRCPFCHNPRVVFGNDEQFSPDSIFSFLKKRVGILDGVCITGGEPTLYGDALTDLVRYIKSLGYLVKLDTNGSNPHLLADLISQRLVDYVAMDIKNALTEDRYSAACGTSIDLSDIRKSISILNESGIDFEFRTTVVRGIHTKEDILSAARDITGGKKYFLQAFVDSGDLIDAHADLSAFTKQEMEDMASCASEYIGTKVRGI